MSDAGTTTTITAVVAGTRYEMRVTVPPGDPNTLYATARSLHAQVDDLNTFGTTIGDKGAGIRDSAQWHGDAAENYGNVISALSGAVRTQGTPYTRVASAITTYAGTLEWGQGAARDPITTTQDAAKKATASTIQSLVDQTHQRAAHITNTVSQAANDARGAVDSATEEESHGWVTAVKENFLWKKIEAAHMTFDALAGDAWLETLKHGGEAFEEAENKFTTLFTYVADLAHDADTTGNWDVVKECYQLARSKSGIDDLAKTLGIDASRLGKMLPGLKIAGYGLDAIGVFGDALTLADPEDKGALGHIDQGAAVLNAAGTAAGLAGDLGLIAEDGALATVPGVGEVFAVGTGLYLAGDYLYHNWKPFRNVCNDVGHTAVHVGDDISHMAYKVWHSATSWL